MEGCIQELEEEKGRAHENSILLDLMEIQPIIEWLCKEERQGK